MSKKFTNLPSHTSVRIEMRFYYIRTWDDESALVYVDNILRWRNSHSHRRQTNNACSGQEGHFVDLDIVINSHTASEITLRVTSTLDQNAGDEAFGIQNVIVSPYTLDVGKGIGPLPEGGTINFDEAAGIAPWGGIGLEVKTCQGASGLVVTGNGGDDPSSFAAAHFTDISEHNAIRMTGTFVFLNPEASQKAQLFIDSEQLWEMSSDKGDADCSGQGVPFEVYTAHTSKEAKIDFSGDRVGKNSFKPSFALRNLKVELQILGSSPWAKGVSDFSKGMDGWLGAGNLQRTTCDDPIGVILGGTDTQPKGSVTSKTYTDLPKHTSLIVRFTVVYMSWEGDYPAQLVVDGDNLWSLPYSKVLNRESLMP